MSDDDLTGRDLKHSTLDGTRLGARFERATLDNADLAGATLTGSTISRAASLSGTNLFDVVGLTPRQKTVCERKGAVFIEPSNPDWREWGDEDEDLDEDAFD